MVTVGLGCLMERLGGGWDVREHAWLEYPGTEM